jgi:hypothetical protein
MPEEGAVQDEHARLNTYSKPIVWVVIGAIVGFALLIVVGKFFVNQHSERIKFVTVNTLSLFVLLAILVQAYIYSKEWRVMRQSLRQTDKMIETMQHGLSQTAQVIEKMQGQLELMREQVIASEAQFRVAGEGIRVAEKNSIDANRAYVAASIDRIEERFRFHLLIENTGNTPANDVRISYGCSLREKPPVDKAENGQISYHSDWSYEECLGVIAAKSGSIVVTPKFDQLTGPEHQKWKLSQVKFYCWGLISYEDIFNERRLTWFCFHQSQAHPNGYPDKYGNQVI